MHCVLTKLKMVMSSTCNSFYGAQYAVTGYCSEQAFPMFPSSVEKSKCELCLYKLILYFFFLITFLPDGLLCFRREKWNSTHKTDCNQEIKCGCHGDTKHPSVESSLSVVNTEHVSWFWSLQAWPIRMLDTMLMNSPLYHGIHE